MDILQKPWVWVVGLLIGAMLLMGGRKGGGSTSNLNEVTAIAAATNVQLSSISAGTTAQAYQYQSRLAELAADKYYTGMALLKSGISQGNQVLLQREQTKRDIALAGIAADTARTAENYRFLAIKGTNNTVLNLGKIQASVRGKEIAMAPTLARINSQAAQVIARIQGDVATRVSDNDTVARIRMSDNDTIARHDEARYRYKAAKAGANADMVGSAFDFAGGIL